MTRLIIKSDPHFGDNDLLKKVVQKPVIDLAIRVMLDAVFNHCSEQFPPFQDVLQYGEKSKYADWFHVNEYPVQIKDGYTNLRYIWFLWQYAQIQYSQP